MSINDISYQGCFPGGLFLFPLFFHLYAPTSFFCFFLLTIRSWLFPAPVGWSVYPYFRSLSNTLIFISHIGSSVCLSVYLSARHTKDVLELSFWYFSDWFFSFTFGSLCPAYFLCFFPFFLFLSVLSYSKEAISRHFNPFTTPKWFPVAVIVVLFVVNVVFLPFQTVVRFHLPMTISFPRPSARQSIHLSVRLVCPLVRFSL